MKIYAERHGLDLQSFAAALSDHRMMQAA